MIRAEKILYDKCLAPEESTYLDGFIIDGHREPVDKAMKQITWEGWIALIKIVVGPKADIALIEKEYREKFNQWYEKEVK